MAPQTEKTLKPKMSLYPVHIVHIYLNVWISFSASSCTYYALWHGSHRYFCRVDLWLDDICFQFGLASFIGYGGFGHYQLRWRGSGHGGGLWQLL